jgi:hypothetical protein
MLPMLPLLGLLLALVKLQPLTLLESEPCRLDGHGISATPEALLSAAIDRLGQRRVSRRQFSNLFCVAVRLLFRKRHEFAPVRANPLTRREFVE